MLNVNLRTNNYQHTACMGQSASYIRMPSSLFSIENLRDTKWGTRVREKVV